MSYRRILEELLAKYLNIMEKSLTCILPPIFFSFHHLGKLQPNEMTYRKCNAEYLLTQRQFLFTPPRKLKRARWPLVRTRCFKTMSVELIAQRIDYWKGLWNSKRPQHFPFPCLSGKPWISPPLRWYGSLASSLISSNCWWKLLQTTLLSLSDVLTETGIDMSSAIT